MMTHPLPYGHSRTAAGISRIHSSKQLGFSIQQKTHDQSPGKSHEIHSSSEKTRFFPSVDSRLLDMCLGLSAVSWSLASSSWLIPASNIENLNGNPDSYNFLKWRASRALALVEALLRVETLLSNSYKPPPPSSSHLMSSFPPELGQCNECRAYPIASKH
ncbi:hypothetical protein BJY01DRAFT_8486 [Aspergillus pseudoustus]|uniref:Uncharacterized protein n=1 Tax=Aspergillus pseudoustus TaxID=1810923 RepID=A0ABR4JRI9_9EURO